MISLPRLLFFFTVAAAGVLILLVFLAPLLHDGKEDGLRVVVALFAQDAALRRTAVASGVGLLVTACVFFRPPSPKSPSPNPRLPPPPDIAGA